VTNVREKRLFYEQLAAWHKWEEFANEYETVRRLRLVYDRLLPGDEIRGRRFLDVGSGGGHFSAVAAARGAEVWSVDVGEELLAQVPRKCVSHRVIGDVLGLPFEEGFFDIVPNTRVIEHIAVRP